MASDSIKIDGMKFHAFHGCLDFERMNGQDFFVDVMLKLELKKAGQSDELTDTVDYAAVYTDVKEIMETKPPFRLIESVAEKIAECLLKKYPLEAVRIVVHKPHAPIEGEFADVSVTVRRKQGEV